MSLQYYENQIFEREILEDYQSSEFISCHFNSLDLSDKSFRGTKFIECTFNKCNMSNIIILSSTFSDAKFSICKLVGMNWSSCSNLRDLKFFDCKMDFSVFQDLNLQYLELNNCSLVDGDFSRSQLQNAKFINCNLKNSIFNNCDLEKADFRQSINYWLDPRACKLKNAKFSMPEAVALIEALGVKVDL